MVWGRGRGGGGDHRHDGGDLDGNRGVVNQWGGVHHRGVVDDWVNGVVDWVDSVVDWVDGVVDGVDWGGPGVVDKGVVGSVGLVDSVGDGGAVTVDHLVGGLVSGGGGHKGGDSEESLREKND